MLHSETTEVVLVQFNIFNNDCQHYARILYIFIPNTSFGELLGIANKNFEKPLIQSSHILKYNLLLKMLNHYRYIKDLLFRSSERSNISQKLWIFVFCLKYDEKCR